MPSEETADPRSVRLVELLGCLSDGPPQTTAQLAERFGVTTRTVNRNLETLEQSGVQLSRDPATSTVSIVGVAFLRPIDFTLDEASALLTAASSFSQREGIPGFRALQLASDKLLQWIPEPLRPFLRHVDRRVHVEFGPRSQPDRAGLAYAIFREAVFGHQTVQMEYAAIWDNQTISTKLDPYFLMFQRRTWYAVGYSHWHKEVRTFHLGRVQQPQLTGERFSADDLPTPEQHFRNAWGMIPGEKTFVVRVRFSAKVARNVSDVKWHPTQSFEWAENGSVVMTVTVDGLDEIAWWILGYGSQAEAIEPPELREILFQHASEMRALYA